MATLEPEADVAVDANRAGDALLHLPVAALQLLHQLPWWAGPRGPLTTSVPSAEEVRQAGARAEVREGSLEQRCEPRQGAGPWTAGRRPRRACAAHTWGARGEGGRRAPGPTWRSFLLMTTWHLMHFFILRAHSAGEGTVE